MVAKATAARKPSRKFPPTALARCMATMLPPPTSLPPRTPPSKKDGSLPTMRMAASPMMKMTLKK
jgi:hypothetical protein